MVVATVGGTVVACAVEVGSTAVDATGVVGGCAVEADVGPASVDMSVGVVVCLVGGSRKQIYKYADY